MSHSVAVILTYASVFVMCGCIAILFTHKESHMQKLALMVSSTLLISCLGFLIKIEATSVDGLIDGQKLVYFSVTHSMFLMLLFIFEYCNFKIPKTVEIIFHTINFAISAIIVTVDYHSLFYKSYWMAYEHGYPVLQKDYGFVHTIAVAVFGIYMAAAIIAVVVFSVKNIKKKKQAVWKLLVAVIIPCGAYIVPKLTGDVNEMQPVAFAVFMVMVVYLIYSNNLYDIDNIASRFISESTNEALIVFDSRDKYKGANKKAIEFFPKLSQVCFDEAIDKDEPEVYAMLKGKTREYRTGDCIFDVTVRQINNEGHTTGRVIWMRDITMERRYTDLLKSRNRSLESEVDTLTDISLKDVLTGLSNRRAYDDFLGEIKSGNHPSKVAVGVLDLNGLKKINDSRGHSAGDMALIAASQIINRAFAEIGNIFRTGGDEFCVIVDENKASDEDLKSRIVKAMEEYNEAHSSEISLAYGFARAAEDADTSVDELLITADRNMYECKRAYYHSIN